MQKLNEWDLGNRKNLEGIMFEYIRRLKIITYNHTSRMANLEMYVYHRTLSDIKDAQTCMQLDKI